MRAPSLLVWIIKFLFNLFQGWFIADRFCATCQQQSYHSTSFQTRHATEDPVNPGDQGCGRRVQDGGDW